MNTRLMLSVWLWSLLLLVSLAAAAQVAMADGACLLSASQPGAYAVRFWPDRAVLTYSTKDPVTVSVQLPQAATWARLDDDKLAGGKLKWDAKAKLAALELPAGDHTVHVAWAGSYQKPAEGQKIPVTLGGKKIGELAAHFALQGMTAEGTVNCPAGRYAAALKPMPKELAGMTLSLGSSVVVRDGQMVTDRQPLLAEGTPISLVINSYNLASSPVKELSLERVAVAVEPKRLEAMPAQGIKIEAEDFTAEDGPGKTEISTKHFETSGGKSIFSNSGDGHWLEYTVTVPQAGTYDLYVRAATQEPLDLRSVMVDGKFAPGLALVKFPGTGGWGYSTQEWAALQLTGLPEAASLKLEAGEHKLRVTGEGSTHLNLDYLMLVPK